MKIVLVTQYFFPENFKSNDIAFELVRRGHDVTVLTGLPNYPEGKIYNGYGFFKKRRETINGVKVIRASLIPRGKGGGIRLFLNYFSWAFFASIRAFFLAFQDKFDLVLVHEPSPITQGFPAIIIKKIQKIPLYFWVLDLWPESLTSAGGIKDKTVLSFFTGMVKYIYNNSDKILISSKGFKESILTKGNYEDKLIYFPNWAEDSILKGDSNYPIPELPQGFKILFAGNIGVAQDVNSIIKAALLLKETLDIHFVFVGDGRSKQELEDFVMANNLEQTVYFMGRFPIDAMKTFFSRADVLLVSLKDELIFNVTVPAKLQAYLCTQKPILGILNGEGAELIKEANCGFSVNAGNSEGLAKEILKLYDLNEEERNILGQNGFRYFEENFTMTKCINNLELILKS
ncbi:glycosyltransferase family 4 protein [Flavobacterium sp. Fl-77]|uniref:Glycosyltransferase family 4 protein n=1 Tax=Flavobacterium flavipigmentatum TaxID=2893884 RepID=A0AAJ2S8K7_9FLAO|nr:MULTISPECIES: glycosyltransferase family 4 protein [unclassified Flavobacterium]MDX6182216.1 glycosyltransferase family 4 protein [Flavobacterium sp. Fl-33]MDX6185871.1 glycosyltransferase family 4 protein [Flavobacterium sp. Fl-77]UFH39049.1 glycosyltransferase family 4 protein [Flavobacterium sp. F-70]